MEVFDVEESPRRSQYPTTESADPLADAAEADEADGAAAEPEPAQLAGASSLLEGTSSTFDVEDAERTPTKERKRREKKPKKEKKPKPEPDADSASDAVDTEAGARMCQGSVDKFHAAWIRLTDKANLVRNFKIWVGLQILMYVVWLLMYSGLVVPVGRGMMQVRAMLRPLFPAAVAG